MRNFFSLTFEEKEEIWALQLFKLNEVSQNNNDVRLKKLIIAKQNLRQRVCAMQKERNKKSHYLNDCINELNISRFG